MNALAFRFHYSARFVQVQDVVARTENSLRKPRAPGAHLGDYQNAHASRLQQGQVVCSAEARAGAFQQLLGPVVNLRLF